MYCSSLCEWNPLLIEDESSSFSLTSILSEHENVIWGNTKVITQESPEVKGHKLLHFDWKTVEVMIQTPCYVPIFQKEWILEQEMKEKEKNMNLTSSDDKENGNETEKGKETEKKDTVQNNIVVKKDENTSTIIPLQTNTIIPLQINKIPLQTKTTPFQKNRSSLKSSKVPLNLNPTFVGNTWVKKKSSGMNGKNTSLIFKNKSKMMNSNMSSASKKKTTAVSNPTPTSSGADQSVKLDSNHLPLKEPTMLTGTDVVNKTMEATTKTNAPTSLPSTSLPSKPAASGEKVKMNTKTGIKTNNHDTECCLLFKSPTPSCKKISVGPGKKNTADMAVSMKPKMTKRKRCENIPTGLPKMKKLYMKFPDDSFLSIELRIKKKNIQNAVDAVNTTKHKHRKGGPCPRCQVEIKLRNEKKEFNKLVPGMQEEDDKPIKME